MCSSSVLRRTEAKALCLVAQARGICGEPAGVSAAKAAKERRGTPGKMGKKNIKNRGMQSSCKALLLFLLDSPMLSRVLHWLLGET